MEEIFKRVSVRKYLDKPVEKEKIEKILKAGMQAPSAGNQQPWEFYVVENKELIEKLSKVSEYSKFVKDAPVVIVPCYRLNGLKFPEYDLIDLSICTENMWLEESALGLGGVMLGIAPHDYRMQYVEKVLNIPMDVRAFALLTVGYPAEDKKQQDRFDKNRIHYC